MKSSSKSLLKIIASTTMSFVGGLVVCEVICNLFDVGRSAYIQPDSRLGYKLIGDKIVEWNFEGYSRDKTSSAGFRDVEHKFAKEPGVRRILILGDSYAEGLQVPLEQTLARQLQHQCDVAGKPRFEIINAACSAYSLGQMVQQYEELADIYQPDEVFLLKSNSFEKALLNVRNPRDYAAFCRPYFYLKNNVLVEDDSLLPPPAYCNFFGCLLRQSRIANLIANEDFVRSFNDRNYKVVRSFFVSRARMLYCRSIDYPIQNNDLVKTALFARLSRDVRAHNARLTVFALPGLDPKNPDDGNKSLARLGSEHGFTLVDLRDTFTKAGPQAFLKHHLSEYGHKVVATEMRQELSRKYCAVAARSSVTE